MDSWSNVQLKYMQVGGNRKFKEFCWAHSIPDGADVHAKYDSHCAKLYREKASREANILITNSQVADTPTPLVDNPTTEVDNPTSDPLNLLGWVQQPQPEANSNTATGQSFWESWDLE